VVHGNRESLLLTAVLMPGMTPATAACNVLQLVAVGRAGETRSGHLARLGSTHTCPLRDSMVIGGCERRRRNWRPPR